MKTNRLHIQNLTLASMLTALAVLMASPIFAYVIMLFGVPAVRIDLIAIPILIAGMLMGPLYGLGVGAAADIFGFLLFSHVFGPYHFGFTLNLALTGFLSGLFMNYFKHFKHADKLSLINILMLTVLLAFGAIYLGINDTITINGTAHALSLLFKGVFTGFMVLFYALLVSTILYQRKKHAKDHIEIDKIVFIVLFIEVFVVITLTPLWVYQLYQAPPYIAGLFLRIIRALWLIPVKVYLVYLIYKVAQSVFKESFSHQNGISSK